MRSSPCVFRERVLARSMVLLSTVLGLRIRVSGSSDPGSGGLEVLRVSGYLLFVSQSTASHVLDPRIWGLGTRIWGLGPRIWGLETLGSCCLLVNLPPVMS